MPTLPLYTPNAIADASHGVAAPGGYEAWHFDAETSSGDLRLVATLARGDPFRADYLARYQQYRRRPTRWPPPLPAQYPGARVAVYEKQRLLGQFTTQFSPDQFSASAQRPQVRAGPNEFVRGQDGALSLRLRGALPGNAGSGRDQFNLSADLTFRPVLRHAPHEACLLSPPLFGDEHRWVVADPLCEVSGTVSLTARGDARGRGAARDIDFRGRGYHDHTYGTGPLPASAGHWLRGRLLLGERVVAFYAAAPLNRYLPVQARLVEADAAGVRELAVAPVKTSGWRRVAGGGQYPLALHIAGPGIPEWTLADPVLLGSSDGPTRLIYSGGTGTHGGPVLCEVGVAPGGRWRIPARQTGAAAGRADGHAAVV